MDETVDAPAAVFVLCDRASPAAEGVRAHLAAADRNDARWFDVRDVNDLERAAGLVGGPIVVITEFQVLATLLWEGALDTNLWRSPQLLLEFVPAWRPLAGPAGAGPVEGDVTAAFRALVVAWDNHRTRRRRERTIAGFCLSLVAIAAAFVIVLLSR